MALSVVGGNIPCPLPNPEDDVLCELNAEFRQSKSELIQRFLRDQEDLNQKFAEYELNSDDGDGCESERSETSSGVTNLSSPHLPGESGPVFDVLEDIEDKELIDNLSITSAVNSSSDAPSLSDGAERASYEDLDEEHEFDENWNVTAPQAQNPPGSYDDHYYDQYKRDVMTRPHPDGSSYNQGNSYQPLDLSPQPRKSKKNNKESTPTRKVKKLLVKKNIRPQTAVGLRALPDREDLLCTPPPSDSRPKPISAGSTTFTLHDSINMVGARFKKISWSGAGTDHPELGRLSISASVHKLPQRSHTPGGRLKSSSSPLIPNSGLAALRSGGGGSGGGVGGFDGQDKRPSVDPLIRNPLSAPGDLRDPFRSCTPLGRPESTMSNRSLISVDFGPDPLTGRRSRTTQSPLVRSTAVYSAERGNGRLMMSPSLGDGKTKKRPIAVLKLPPLDSSVVNRAIGAANLAEGAGPHQSSLVSPATTANSSTVAPPSAI